MTRTSNYSTFIIVAVMLLSGQNLAVDTKVTGQNLAVDTKATGQNLDHYRLVSISYIIDLNDEPVIFNLPLAYDITITEGIPPFTWLYTVQHYDIYKNKISTI
jgi:hypothetical protein